MAVRPPSVTITPHERRHRGRRSKLYPVLLVMLGELEAAEPGRRHLILDDVGKVTGALREPSTFPRWLDEFGVRRTRKVVDRLIRVIKAGLRSDEMALPRLTLRTERYGWIKDKKITLERIVERWPNFMLERDLDLWRRVREFAERNYEKFCRPLSLEEIDRLASASDIE